MAKRFGRNQKRALHLEVADLKLKLAEARAGFSGIPQGNEIVISDIGIDWSIEQQSSYRSAEQTARVTVFEVGDELLTALRDHRPLAFRGGRYVAVDLTVERPSGAWAAMHSATFVLRGIA